MPGGPILSCGLGNTDAESHAFATDKLYAPEAILPGHLLDRGDGFSGDPGVPVPPVAGLGPPEQPEALPMPAQERIGLDDKEDFLPSPDGPPWRGGRAKGDRLG